MRATTPSSMAANPPRTYGISRLLLYDELHALHPQDTHGGVRLYDLPSALRAVQVLPSI